MGFFLVRHGRGAFLALGEAFFGFQHFGALQMAQLGGQALHPAGNEGQGGKKGGMAVALDDLGGDGVHAKAKDAHGNDFDLGIEMGVAAHGPGDLAHPDAVQGRDKAFAVAGKFSVKRGHLHAEAERFGVDAVGAPDHELPFEPHGQIFDNGQQLIQIGHDYVAGPAEQQGVGGVDDVGGGAAQVNKPGGRADAFFHGG